MAAIVLYWPLETAIILEDFYPVLIVWAPLNVTLRLKSVCIIEKYNVIPDLRKEQYVFENI